MIETHCFPLFLTAAKKRHEDVFERAVLLSSSHSHFQLPSYCHSVNPIWCCGNGPDTEWLQNQSY